MPKSFLNYSRMYACFQQHRGVNMAQVMQPKVRKTSSRNNFGKSVSNSIWIKRTTIYLSKYEVIILLLFS